MSRPPDPVRSARRLALALAVIAVLLPLWLHKAFASSDALIYLADSAQLQYPRYRILCEALQVQRAFPLWQDLLYGGMPFHASPENPTLYPPILLFCAFAGPVLVMNLVTLSGLALAALGAFLLVARWWRRIGPSAGDPRADAAAAGGLVAATAFALAHWTRTDHLNLVAYGHAHAWVPWLLLALDHLLTGERPTRAAGCFALLCALEFHTGGLYVFPYAFLLAGAWLLFHGLLGGPVARRRTLRLALPALLAAGLLAAAKLVPYLEWAPTTNRAGRLPYEDALAQTLGGRDGFTWKLVWKNVQTYAAGGWPLLLALCAVPLARRGLVRTLLAMLAFGFAVACGGPAYRLLYELVPPFGQIRQAVRAWTLVNALYPLLAGLGTAWLLSRWSFLRERPRSMALVALCIALPLGARSFRSSERHDAVLHHPERLGEVLERYHRWPEAARRAGGEWRAFWVDKRTPDGRNEQFISTALGVESPTGYLGHVWPAALERFLYGPEEARLGDAQRLRRLGVLSTRFLVTRDPAVPPEPSAERLFPPGVDGTALFENELARPRAFLPAVVVGIAGDPGDELLLSLLDDPRFPLGAASLIALDGGAAVAPEELAGFDLFVLGPAEEAAASLWPKLLGAHGRGVVRVSGAGNEEQREALLAEIAELARERAAPALEFRRLEPGATVVLRAPDAGEARARFALVSEPWALYPGWQATLDGTPTAIRRADGIVSALLLPPGAELVLRYRPRSASWGALLGLVGLALAAALLFSRERSGG